MTKSTIIINGKFLSQRVTGVQRYARELILELDKQLDGEVGMDFVLAVPKDAKDVPEYRNIKVTTIGDLKGLWWEQLTLPFYAMGRGTLINPCNASPLLKPDIVCLHDVRIKARPQDLSNSFLTWYRLLYYNATKKAKKIITVSEFSKRELVKYYHLSDDRVCVIPNAWQHYNRVGYDEGALEKYSLTRGDYYFSMSSLEPNKNFKWIAEMAKKMPNRIFAVAGSVNTKVFSSRLGFDCPANMKLLGYVSDEEAKTLMRDCRAFLFPTFYEGFGIPPLEAIVVGCKKVVVSDTEVMHEVFGDSVVYIDPNTYILNEETIVTPSRSCIDRYSWESSATQLLSLLKETLMGGG